MIAVELLGYIAGTLTTIALVPEIYRTWRKKEARDLSFYWLGCLGIGCGIWIIYGALIGSYPVIIANVVSVILCCVQITLAVKYDKIRILTSGKKKHR